MMQRWRLTAIRPMEFSGAFAQGCCGPGGDYYLIRYPQKFPRRLGLSAKVPARGFTFCSGGLGDFDERPGTALGG